MAFYTQFIDFTGDYLTKEMYMPQHRFLGFSTM